MKKDVFPGYELREKRESFGLSVGDVYRKLRIPSDIIEAFESDRIEDLPGTTYAIGFLKTYCTFLELDPERFADALRECSRPETNFLGLPAGEDAGPRPGWLTDVAAWAAITAILALGWFTYSVTIQPKASRGENQVQADELLPEEMPARESR